MFPLPACKKGLSHPLLFLLSVSQVNRNNGDLSSGVASLLVESRRTTAVLQLPWHHLCTGEMQLFCLQVLNWELLLLLMLSHMQLFNFSTGDLRIPIYFR